MSIHVRWKPDLTDARRLELERSLHLVKGHHLEGTTWRYRLANVSTPNINAIVQNELVEDTAHLNRTRYRPRFDMDRSRQILVSSVAIGAAASVLLLVMIGYRRQDIPFAVSWSQLVAALSPTVGSEAASGSMAATTQPPSVVAEPAAAPMTLPLHGFRAVGAVLLAGVLATAAMTSFAQPDHRPQRRLRCCTSSTQGSWGHERDDLTPSVDDVFPTSGRSGARSASGGSPGSSSSQVRW